MRILPLLLGTRVVGRIAEGDINDLRAIYGTGRVITLPVGTKRIKSVKILAPVYKTPTRSSEMPGGSSQHTLSNLGNGVQVFELINDRTSEAYKRRKSEAA